MKAIDFHVHAFPDEVARRAVPKLEASSGVRAFHDGTIGGLLRSMDAAQIERAVVCSIATKPSQVEPICQWSAAIVGERLIPLPSVHPDDPDAVAQVGRMAAEGFKGIKLHPYYQGFVLDEERMMPIYEAVARAGMLLVCHTGFDISFPRERRADPVRVCRVCDRFPSLRFVATHLGGWDEWDEVERHLIGQPIRLETSFALAHLPPERAQRMLLAHPAEMLFFGTDSPWKDQQDEQARLRALELPSELERAILRDNALRELEG